MFDSASRWAAPVAIAALVAVGVVSSRQSLAVASVAAVVAVVAVAASGPASGWQVLPGAIASGMGVAVVGSGSGSNLGWFAMCVLAGWCALRGGVRPAIVVCAGVVAGFVVQWLWLSDDPGWGAWIAGTVFTAVVCLMARQQRDLLDQLRDAQAGLAERAATQERARIARELHDVIGHALTVSLLHVTSARLALREDPDEAARTLAEAERLAQQSLAEVRQAVGLLRDAGVSSRSPLPGADQLDELVEGFRRTGTPLQWDVLGDPANLSATSGLTVYRILQEALTNVARHAPGATTDARLLVATERVELTVDSAAPGRGDSVGAGLMGMQERAEAVGGTVVAGPSERGWRVRAVLPGACDITRAERT